MPFLLFVTLFALLDFVILFAVGGQIGLLTTLLLVLATGFIGLYLIRLEGTAALARARLRLDRGELPSSELLTGAALIFGGALLLTPGFLSDTLGLLCVIPGARRGLARLLAMAHLRGRDKPHSRGHGPEDGWQQASGNRHDGGEQQQHHDGSQQQPLEGDFIGRDEHGR